MAKSRLHCSFGEIMDTVEEKQDAITFPYEKDGITLHCGDNCETMLLMPAESVDLVVTSPPYDDLRTYGGHSWDFYGVAWNLKRLLKPGGVIVWNVADATKEGGETGTSMRQAMYFQTLGLQLFDTMIYEKDGVSFPDANRYQQCWEYMFVFSKGMPAVRNLIEDRKNVSFGRLVTGTDRNKDGTTREASCKGNPIKEFGVRWNVWRLNNTAENGKRRHPAPFPEALARDHILTWSNEGDTVLDPFSGSGTTIKMARETGRRGIGIEINEEYCQIAVTRLRQRLLFGMEESVG